MERELTLRAREVCDLDIKGKSTLRMYLLLQSRFLCREVPQFDGAVRTTGKNMTLQHTLCTRWCTNRRDRSGVRLPAGRAVKLRVVSELAPVQ